MADPVIGRVIGDTPDRAELARLVAGAAELGVALAPEPCAQLLRLLDELQHWGARMNLTAIRDRPRMLTHHLLDSLSAAPFIAGRRIADLGTGAGFPGLPLAIVQPEREFTLIDSTAKKIAFVSHAARHLGLANVQARHARAADLAAGPPFDTVVARAVAPLPELVALAAPLSGAATRLLAMQGRHPGAGSAALPAPWRLDRVVPIVVPGLGEERHLLLIGRVELTRDATGPGHGARLADA